MPEAMQFVKTVMDQILASIQITNIETYISDVNRLLREVEAHNFSLRNDDIALELENAKAGECVLTLCVLVIVC